MLDVTSNDQVINDEFHISLKGVNGSLLVSLTGSDSATVTEVTLVESSGSEEIKGVVEPQGSGNFLVHVDVMPSVEFAVRLKGRDDGVASKASSIVFQRQSSTNFRASNLTVTVSSHPRSSLCHSHHLTHERRCSN